MGKESDKIWGCFLSFFFLPLSPNWTVCSSIRMQQQAPEPHSILSSGSTLRLPTTNSFAARSWGPAIPQEQLATWIKATASLLCMTCWGSVGLLTAPELQVAAMYCFASEVRYEGERKQRLHGILFYASKTEYFVTMKQLWSAVSTEIKPTLFDWFSKILANFFSLKSARTPN